MNHAVGWGSVVSGMNYDNRSVAPPLSPSVALISDWGTYFIVWGTKGIFFGPWQIDPYIVKTPKPIKMVILGPKNDSFGLNDPDLFYRDDTYKYFEYL